MQILSSCNIQIKSKIVSGRANEVSEYMTQRSQCTNYHSHNSLINGDKYEQQEERLTNIQSSDQTSLIPVTSLEKFYNKTAFLIVSLFTRAHCLYLMLWHDGFSPYTSCGRS